MISLSFILTSLIVVIIPGTGVIYTVTAGLGGSKKDSASAAVGCTLGIIPHLAAGILGLSAILHVSAGIFQLIKLIGVGYLIYLGYGLITAKSGITVNEKPGNTDYLTVVLKGILLNLLNPKLTLFFFSFLPQFINSSDLNYVYQMMILSSIFMGMTLVVFLGYGMLANYFKELFIGSPRLIKRIQKGFGIVLIGFAVRLALSDD